MPGRLIRYLTAVISTVCFVGHLIFFAVYAPRIYSLRDHNPQVTSLMRFRRLQNKHLSRDAPSFTHLDHIPDKFINDVITIEDTNFNSHFGFDAMAIYHALRLNRKLGYSAYGASTISQQLARTLFLTPEKTLTRKYRELLLALLLELFLDKRRILELYLNYVEWGENIYGVTDASRYHYGKPLAQLDLSESQRLITILANPLKFNPITLFQNRQMRLRLGYLHYHALQNEKYPLIKK